MGPPFPQRLLGTRELPRGVGIERDLNATGGAYRFKTSSERRGRPTRRGSAGLEAGAHRHMFGEYAFMEDSCNASPELFCQRKRMNFSSREP